MKIATIIVRVLLGLVFIVFGSNLLHPFLPLPPMHGPAGDFLTAMGGTGYLKVVGILQVAGGVILLLGRFVPLGLTLLGPVIVNILCFHIFLAPAGLPPALVVAALTLFLLWRYRASFAGLMKA